MHLHEFIARFAVEKLLDLIGIPMIRIQILASVESSLSLGFK